MGIPIEVGGFLRVQTEFTALYISEHPFQFQSLNDKIKTGPKAVCPNAGLFRRK